MPFVSWFLSVLQLQGYKTAKKWRRYNDNNFTEIDIKSNNIKNCKVGSGTYGIIKVFNDRPERSLLIGNYCSIAQDVTFIVGRDHHIDSISSYPFKQMFGLADSEYRDAISKGDIIVEDDVWIGYGATILSNVIIGQGAVIAAGAVVTQSVPPYAVVGGIPAKVIKYRFSHPVIDYLLTLDYGMLTEEMIKAHIDDLYKQLDEMSLDELKDLFSWFPKKHS